MNTLAQMPLFFFSHGSPMNAIEENIFTQDWLNLHLNTHTPKAIVIFSAHWHVPGTRVLSSSHPRTIHDFGGFPSILHQQHYACQGEPSLAKSIVGTLFQSGFRAQLDEQWGLDHGSWSLLKHLYPAADIPVLQISLDNTNNDLLHHYRIGQALREYRDQGVLFIGSGGIVHNIRKWMHSSPNDPIDWAQDFDHVIAQAIKERDIHTLANFHALPFAKEAVPTLEHYLPLMYIMGLSNEDDCISFSSFNERNLASACSRSFKLS